MYSVIEVKKDSVLVEFQGGSFLRISRDIIDGKVKVNDVLIPGNGRFSVDTRKTMDAKRENYRLAQTLVK